MLCPSGGPAGQNTGREVRSACPSGGPAGQNTRRKDRSACPSGGPAGQAPKETTDSKMPRSHSLCGDSLCGDQKSSRSLSDAPPARSQSARENGDHSEMMRCACGAVTVCLCVALATSHTLLQHLRLCGDSLCEDQKSFRSLSDAPPARSQSARENGDHSEMMRCACGAVTVCLCVALATSHTLLQHLRLCGDSLCEDQKSFRSLSDAPPARAQSARGAADVSGVMRRASQRVRSVCAACAAA